MSATDSDGILGPPDGRKSPRFQGPATFARLPRRDEVTSHDVAIVGVPFDIGTTYRPGARFGPAGIRAGSRLLRAHNPLLKVEPFHAQQVVDAGDITVSPFIIDDAIREIEAGANEALEGADRLIALGGDHTIALPMLRAMNRVHGPVALVHFDAHLDTYDTYMNAPYTHGTPFRRAGEEGLFVEHHSMHVGIRGSAYDAADFATDAELGFGLIGSWDIEHLGISGIAESIRSTVEGRPVYLSIDIDVLDPAYAPATGTPEIGGLSTRELAGILRGLAGVNLVGVDIVEVAPVYDHAEVTSIAAANLIFELLSVMALLKE